MKPAIPQNAQEQSALRAAMFLLYGDPKMGKTTLFLRAFPTALYIGERSAVQLVAESACGFTPQSWQIVEGVSTLQQLQPWIPNLKSKEWQAAIKAHRIPALYIDDFSQICAKSVILWDAEAPAGNDFYAFKMLDRYLDWISFELREAGLLCGLSAHTREPRYDQNKKSRTYGQLIAKGAPDVPSAKQVQSVPGWADLVARVESGPSKDPWWPRVACVDPQASDLWVSGDRNSVCWAETPANLREILNAAPTHYDLPRLPGLEWQDEVAEGVSSALLQKEPILSVAERIFAHYKDYALPGTPGERHVQWAIQDGIARYTIRAHRDLGVLGQLRASAAEAAPPPPPPPHGAANTEKK